MQGQVLGRDEVLLTRDAHRRTSASGEYDILIDRYLSAGDDEEVPVAGSTRASAPPSRGETSESLLNTRSLRRSLKRAGFVDLGTVESMRLHLGKKQSVGRLQTHRRAIPWLSAPTF